MRKGIVALLALVVLVLVLVVPASATQSTHVSGTWPEYGLIEGPPTFTERGKTCLVEGDFWYGWGGDISGRSDAHLTIVSHGPCFDESGALYPKASFREGLKVTGHFTGCVNDDRCGTFEYRELMTFTPVEGGPADAPNYDLEGRIIIEHGTGGLAGLHGVLTEQGGRRDGVEAGGYEGEIHFDPR